MRDDEYTYKKKRRGCFPAFCWIITVALVLFVLGAFLRFTGMLPEKIFSAESSSAEKTASFDTFDGDSASEDTIQALETMAQQHPEVEQVLQNSNQYPSELLDSLSHNSELLTFALDYPEKKGTFSSSINLSDRYHSGEIPLLLQWDENWGYAPYGDGIIGLDGCGPTCLSMVAVGLTGDTSLNPKAVADFSAKNGYLDESTNSTLWTLMTEGAEKLGLYSSEIPLSESRMSEELSEGHPLICCMGPGDFTTQGHFIVLYDYKNGVFSVNDPNSTVRSGETWSYETLEPQIRNIWAFSS